MATVNYSVPGDVKEAFNEAFGNHNRSAVITALMREAVQRVRRGEQSREAIRRILERRRGRRALPDGEIRATRHDGRP